MSLLSLASVRKTFSRGGATIYAVNDVSLDVRRGETLALIGESGSGKSTVARLALRLLDPDGGSVVFDGTDLTTLPARRLAKLRAAMTIVFQEPYQSLNPRQTVGRTIEEPLEIHEPELSRADRRRRVVDALDHVALNASYYERYPGQLSGGQQQRVGIARAIVTRPSFVVLDEPTSSLDLSVRAQILELLAELQREYELAYLFISHDIHTVEYVSDRVAVMYLGRIVEEGPTAAIFARPQHPYTKALLSSALSADPRVARERYLLVGDVPSATELPPGCPLVGRCPIAIAECAAAPVPLLASGEEGHRVACIRPDAAAA